MNPVIELGVAVKTRRTDIGVTVTAVARMSALSRTSVSDLENHRIKDLSVMRTQRLLEVLGMSLEIPAVHAKLGFDPLARMPALELVTQTANAHIKRRANAADLLPAFVGEALDAIPPELAPHLRSILTDTPVATLAKLADQLHSQHRVKRADVWGRMRACAQALKVERDIFAPENSIAPARR